ncbi:MAG: pantetheine-phosphate adenylyltransferase [Candidatus Marinimicrobia bacterium]|jgi:pantetheine-phosphate adenylyltransferase|nr:pantetheine-phosphate adenylyltransferase [Candidatus Neomarinimicrobiota bacterium]MDP6789249.1 pantetheine-phosphate adenylyltransferase [Candidatus Neomarinimicrobiota bacterium]MDP7072569.1 pantetheine-phosphate adenylyltransferase [Candidatus Neomarinimicrobiota bacterium]
MNKKIIYPGTFDPIHNGHIDIAERASKLFDELIFAVAVNSDKSPLFSVEERIAMIEEATESLGNVRACSTEKLVADFAKEENAVALIRGLRHVSDFEFEFQMAMMNYHLNPDIPTILMMPAEQYIHLNSSVVKEVAKLDGDVSTYVPDCVLDRLKSKYKS